MLAGKGQDRTAALTAPAVTVPPGVLGLPGKEDLDGSDPDRQV